MQLLPWLCKIAISLTAVQSVNAWFQKLTPKLLVIQTSGLQEEQLLKEMRQYYSGNVVAAHDLDVY